MILVVDLDNTRNDEPRVASRRPRLLEGGVPRQTGVLKRFKDCLPPRDSRSRPPYSHWIALNGRSLPQGELKVDTPGRFSPCPPSSVAPGSVAALRSEERRVGRECVCR